jgi:hypothetical protein
MADVVIMGRGTRKGFSAGTGAEVIIDGSLATEVLPHAPQVEDAAPGKTLERKRTISTSKEATFGSTGGKPVNVGG